MKVKLFLLLLVALALALAWPSGLFARKVIKPEAVIGVQAQPTAPPDEFNVAPETSEPAEIEKSGRPIYEVMPDKSEPAEIEKSGPPIYEVMPDKSEPAEIEPLCATGYHFESRQAIAQSYQNYYNSSACGGWYVCQQDAFKATCPAGWTLADQPSSFGYDCYKKAGNIADFGALLPSNACPAGFYLEGPIKESVVASKKSSSPGKVEVLAVFGCTKKGKTRSSSPCGVWKTLNSFLENANTAICCPLIFYPSK